MGWFMLVFVRKISGACRSLRGPLCRQRSRHHLDRKGALPGTVGLQHQGKAAIVLAGQIGSAHHVLAGHGRGPFHAVLQFPHVARPVARQHDLERLGTQHQVTVVLAIEFLQEKLGQQRDIVAPLAQRRQKDRDHVDAVVQVGAEFAPGHRLLEILVGGTDQPHIHLDGFVAAHPLELPFLQHAQEFGLESRRDLADLVEKQGAAMGQLETPLAFGGGAGEGAFFVPEQFGLQQGFGQRGTIERDERPFAARTQVVEGAGDDFLAGTALPAQQDRGAAGRHLVDLGKNLLHPLRHADDVFQAVFALQLLLEPVLLLHEGGALGADMLMQMGRLADQVGRHLEQPDDALVADGDAARSTAGDTEHTYRTAAHLDRHPDECHHFVREAAMGARAVQEQGLDRNIGDHHGHAALHDLARDAFAHLEPSPHLFFGRQAGRFEDLEFTGLLYQADRGATVEVAGEDGHHLAHGPLQVQG